METLKVMLIDDEPIITQGLSKVMKWNEYGCEVVATAEDAKEGAELIRKERPDILFTDICMPGTDGLTMLAGLRSEFPDMQVTVLSGYSEFTYAKEAIRLGVARYLVKPSKMDELHEALGFMAGKCREGRKLRAAGEPGGRESLNEPVKENVSDENTVWETAAADAAEEWKESPSGSFITRQALEYMEKHYAEKIALQDVADHCYVSSWHLSKLLNRYEGKSFYDILNSLRIAQAKRLLADPKCRIGDISEMVGYVDTAHFSRVFKKLEGISANEYRNRMR